MSRLALLCVAVGEWCRNVHILTREGMERYAGICGAEFVVIEDHSDPIWARLLMKDLLGDFDRILYLDADVAVRPDAPNLFERVPETHLGVCLTSRNTKFHEADIEEMQKLNPDIGWKEDYFNSGVMLASRAHRRLFDRSKDATVTNRFPDQSWLNYRAQKLKIPLFDIGYKFNHTTVPPGREEMASYFTHFCGIHPALKSAQMRRFLAKLKAEANFC
jgi:lipopolysaccharide biosynthesis glycosyltransferase